MACRHDGAPLVDYMPMTDRTESIAMELPARSGYVSTTGSGSPETPPSLGGYPDEATRAQRPPRRPEHAAAKPHPERTADLAALEPNPMVLAESRHHTPLPPGSPEERIGKVMGSYRLIEILGKGGMGCVYRAEHIKLGREVALKLLREDYAKRKDAVARFFQEARSVNKIRHRNIVDVTDYDDESVPGTVFIIMELLDGHNLGRLMRAPGAIDTMRALGMLAQICDGLSAAHAVGIVHRDLKPDNIVVVRQSDGTDLVKILDFGVAKLIDRDSEAGQLTAAGSVIGTPAYMSPEQAGGLQVDPRSDIYSLGAIMYELFTRQPVFRGRTFGDYVRKHLNEEPVPPRQVPGGEDCDERIEAMILRCLQKSPNARYPSAADLRGEILALAAALTTQNRTAGPSAATMISVSQGWPTASSSFMGRALGPRGSGQQPQATPQQAAQQAAMAPRGGPARADTPISLNTLDPDEPTRALLSSPFGGSTGGSTGGMTSAATSAAMSQPGDSGQRTPQPGYYGGPPAPMPLFNAVPLHETPWGDSGQGGMAFGTPNPISYGPPTPLPPPGYITGTGLISEVGYSGERVRVGQSRLPWVLVGAIVIAGLVALLLFLVAHGNHDDAVRFPAPPPDRTALAGGSLGEHADDVDTHVPAATGAHDLGAVAPPADHALASPDAGPATGGTVATGTDGAGTVHPADHTTATDHTTGDHDHVVTHVDPPAVKIKVRIATRPPAEIFTTGAVRSLCETPCTLTIDPDDGGPTDHRSYLVRRHGFRDEKVLVDLQHPPRGLSFSLKRLKVEVRHHHEGGDGGGEKKPCPAGSSGGGDGTLNPFGAAPCPQ